MTWQNEIRKVKQDLKEPLDVPKLNALIKALDEAREELNFIIRNNKSKFQESMSPEQYQKWQTKMSKDTNMFKSELTEVTKRIYVMLRTINGKTDKMR
jgi:hypothetical protein